jgi:hypothetical protein
MASIVRPMRELAGSLLPGVTTALGESADAVFVPDEADLDDAIRTLGLARGFTVLVLGGADSTDLEDVVRLTPFLETVVVPAIATLGATVVTGGTDAGVMRAMGAASLAAREPIPIVGVAPFALVRVPGSVGSVPLARGHRAFVLTAGSAWGDESPMLDALARRLGGRPPVLLINGGAIALAEVDRARAGGSHVVVVAGSGRAADGVAAAARARPQLPGQGMTVIGLDDGVLDLIRALRRPGLEEVEG